MQSCVISKVRLVGGSGAGDRWRELKKKENRKKEREKKKKQRPGNEV